MITRYERKEIRAKCANDSATIRPSHTIESASETYTIHQTVVAWISASVTGRSRRTVLRPSTYLVPATVPRPTFLRHAHHVPAYADFSWCSCIHLCVDHVVRKPHSKITDICPVSCKGTQGYDRRAMPFYRVYRRSIVPAASSSCF